MAEKLFVTLEGYEDYEINEDGKVRKISTKKYKNICRDARGRAVVVLPAGDGSMVCEYIAPLLEKYFAIPCEETYNEGIYEEYKEKARQAEEAAREQMAEIERLKTELIKKDMVNENLKESLKEARLAAPKKRPQTIITCVDTGEEFKGFSKAVKKFGFNYDAFYNAFYVNKTDEVMFEGKQFKKEVR